MKRKPISSTTNAAAVVSTSYRSYTSWRKIVFAGVLLFALGVAGGFVWFKSDTPVYLVRQPLLKSATPPVLILLHGYGSNEADLFGLAPELDKRFAIYSLRAPNARSGSGYCWYEIKFLNNGQFDYDTVQVNKSRDYILSFVQNICRKDHLDSSRVYLMGFSQGAILSYELAVSKPKQIKGILALSGRLMKETRQHAGNKTFPNLHAFIAHGNQDEVIALKESEAAQEFFKDKKLKSLEYHVYPMAHSISPTEMNDIRSWLNKQ